MGYQSKDQAPAARAAMGSGQAGPWSWQGAPGSGNILGLALNPGRVALWLFAMVAAIVAMHGITQTYRFVTDRDSVFGLVPLFNMYEEANLPTWFSSLNLFFAALLLYVNAQAARIAGEQWRKHWLGLAGVFLFLSIDEAALLHEKIGAIFKAGIAAESMRSAWMYPFAAMVGVIGLIYVRFLLALPTFYRVMFVLSAGLFVGGAVGLEIIEAKYVWVTRSELITFSVLVGIEEALEMSGIVLFIYTLLRLLQNRLAGLNITART
jgi:hypothetical protein